MKMHKAAIEEARALSRQKGYTFREFLYALNVGKKTPEETRKASTILAGLADSPTRTASG